MPDTRTADQVIARWVDVYGGQMFLGSLVLREIGRLAEEIHILRAVLRPLLEDPWEQRYEDDETRTIVWRCRFCPAEMAVKVWLLPCEVEREYGQQPHEET